MKILKQILAYITWIMVSLLLGIGYMRIVLGPNNTSNEGISYLLYMLYNWGLLYVGLIIGFVIAFLFILLDVVYLKKKLKKTVKSIITRLVVLLVITVIVGGIHYILEKVIDII